MSSNPAAKYQTPLPKQKPKSSGRPCLGTFYANKTKWEFIPSRWAALARRIPWPRPSAASSSPPGRAQSCPNLKKKGLKTSISMYKNLICINIDNIFAQNFSSINNSELFLPFPEHKYCTKMIIIRENNKSAQNEQTVFVLNLRRNITFFPSHLPWRRTPGPSPWTSLSGPAPPALRPRRRTWAGEIIIIIIINSLACLASLVPLKSIKISLKK